MEALRPCAARRSFRRWRRAEREFEANAWRFDPSPTGDTSSPEKWPCGQVGSWHRSPKDMENSSVARPRSDRLQHTATK